MEKGGKEWGDKSYRSLYAGVSGVREVTLLEKAKNSSTITSKHRESCP